MLDPVRRDAGSSYLYTDYDAHGRPVEVGKTTGSFSSADPDAATTGTQTTYKTFSYSGQHVAEAAVPGAVSYRYGYDRDVRVTTVVADVDDLGVKQIGYTYDNSGNVTAIKYQAGVSDEEFYQWFDYDEVGQLLEVRSSETDNKSSANVEAEYTYGPRGEREGADLGDGAETVAYDYHVRGWLTDMTSDDFALSLGYDEVGGPATLGTQVGGDPRNDGTITWMWWQNSQLDHVADVVGYTFDYDELNRLTTADLAKASWSSVNNYDVGVSTPLEYDPNGNLVKLLRKDNSGSGSTMTYSYGIDGSNWLTEVNGNGLSRDYVYDPNGNMTADGDYVTDVDYDIFNMPIEVTTTQATAYNRYDVHNRRVYRRLASVDTTFYVRGADGTTLAVYDGSGDLMYWNILGAGEIIGRAIKGASSTDRQYYVKDHLGSVRSTVKESGSAAHQSDYYPFGLEMPGRVWTLEPPRERYTGHEIEELGSNTTWYYAGARMYDPVVARWMTTDPLADLSPAVSAYSYAMNDVVNLFDPDGYYWVGVDRERVDVRIADDGSIVLSDNASDDLKRYANYIVQSGSQTAFELFMNVSNSASRVHLRIVPEAVDNGLLGQHLAHDDEGTPLKWDSASGDETKGVFEGMPAYIESSDGAVLYKEATISMYEGNLTPSEVRWISLLRGTGAEISRQTALVAVLAHEIFHHVDSKTINAIRTRANGGEDPYRVESEAAVMERRVLSEIGEN